MSTSMSLAARIGREKNTIQTMIRMYCRAHHAAAGAPCPECATLEAYADQRIVKCPWLPAKPTCARCPVHCYKPERREEIRRVMRWAGPRMLLAHPLMTFFHYLDEWTWRPDERLKARLLK